MAVAKVDLEKALRDALAIGGKVQSLQDLADWAIKFGNFYVLLAKLQESGTRVLITQELFTEFVKVVTDQYGGLLAYAIEKTKELGGSTQVELNVEASNLPVELVNFNKYKEQLDKLIQDYHQKPEEKQELN